MKTYVAITIPDKNFPVDNVIVREVDRPTITLVDIPSRAVSLQFFNAASPTGEREAVSPRYIIATKVIDGQSSGAMIRWTDEAKDFVKKEFGHTVNNPARKPGKSALTRDGGEVALDDTDIVITAKKQFLYP